MCECVCETDNKSREKNDKGKSRNKAEVRNSSEKKDKSTFLTHN